MGDSSEVRAWEELIPDALGLIFRNLSLQEVLTVVPRVCKSWGRAVSGPYCWRDIDIEEWSQRCKPEQLDRLLRVLIARSCGSFQRLSVSGLASDSLFSFIAEHAGSLQTLVLPRSEISDAIVEQVSSRLSNITFLDVSYCKKIGPRALESFGKHCKSLIGLRRTMHPLEVADKVSQDDEAFAIACSMPKLRHLEMAYLLLTTRGVLEILSRCKELEFLDLRGCWEVKLDEKLVKESYAGLKVLGPQVEDTYERSFWDECSEEYSDTSDYSWEFMDDDDDGIWDDDDQGFEGLEVRFYGGGFNQAYAGFHWPPSP
ncbi:F-box protein FBW2 [Asparagus officinalis]|uniref:F-box protein FBW2 n=1 Tax=Asparagus officinalis TaxID=4686 RepID=UPI00098E4E20|nr:F-box protein FBW2 [Asparagus officinalis]XP_020255759.1 F-box protein FBW2 [Asparagus officinalis]